MELANLLNKGVKTSIACTLTLMVSHTTLNADYLNSFYKPKTEKMQKSSSKKQISSKGYISLCNKIFDIHTFYWNFLMVEQDYFREFDKNKKIQEKQQIKKLIKNLTKTITEAKKRIENPNYENLKKQNEKVYYSSISLKHLLECIIDDELMKSIGKIDFSGVKDTNILEYGKAVEKTKNELQIALKIFA